MRILGLTALVATLVLAGAAVVACGGGNPSSKEAKQHEDAARAQDSFVLADKLHVLRRPVQAQPRATLRLNDEHESQGIYLRFAEIWDSSLPAVSATTSGL